MKNSSQRERLLTMLLPALLVVTVYGLFFFGGRQKAMTNALTELAKSRAKAPSPSLLGARQAEIAALNADLAKRKLYGAELQLKSDKLMTAFLQPEERQHRIDKLHDLLHFNNLTLLRETPADGNKDGRDMRLSPSQDRLLKLLTEKSTTHQTPLLYRVDLAGRYLDVVELLRVLSEGESVAVPLGVGMHDEKGRRAWTLLLWI